MAINRYDNLNFNGKQQIMPGITISKRSTDKFITYNPLTTKLFAISGSVYNDDTYGWLILLANPEYYMENDIPTNTVLRVPFPLREAESEYNKKVILNKDK